jgi:hypothetical protein
MLSRPVAATAAAVFILAAIALLSQSTRPPPSFHSSLISIDNQPIFSASTDANPNAGWNDPYAPDGVLTRAGGEGEALGQEGVLNENREINADTVPTYDNIVHGQFNRKIHLPYHELVALVSRFRLPPPPPPSSAIPVAKKRHNGKTGKGIASQTNGVKSAAAAAAFAAALKAAKQSYWFQQLKREKAKAAAIEAAKMRAYRRLWQEQGTDYSASPRGSKVRNRPKPPRFFI